MSTADTDWLSFEGSSFTVNSFSRLWILATITYGLGDVVTTIALVYFSPVHTEANPLIRAAIKMFGGGGFLGVKLLVIYACLGISLWAGKQADDWLMFYTPPVLLAVVGIYMTVHNLALLL